MKSGREVAVEKSTAVQIFEAIEDLHNQEQIVTRETLSSMTGLELSIIDDRIKHLVDMGQIVRVQRGVFIPVVRHKPARIISKTMLPSGVVRIEIGDDVLMLTPREARTLGNLMVAETMQYSNIEMGHHMAVLQSNMSSQMSELVGRVNKLVK